MSDDIAQLRCIFTSASLGQAAYRAWADRARHERRFNIARLLEALAASKQAKADYAFAQLGEIADTASNIDRALRGLEPESIATGPVTGTTSITRKTLMRAQRALAEDRDLRADELGDLNVCGRCGYLSEGTLRGSCPTCGTVPEAHRTFRAIDFMGTLGPQAIVHFLEHSEEALRKLLSGLDDDLLARHLSSGQVSLKELAGHLLDMDAVFRERAWLLLETERPELPPAHPPKLDNAIPYRKQTVEAILDAYHDSRSQTLNLLRGLTKAAWHRLGHHEIYGDIDLLHQGNWVVMHERTHLTEMAQIRHDLLIAEGAAQQAEELGEAVIETVKGGE